MCGYEQHFFGIFSDIIQPEPAQLAALDMDRISFHSTLSMNASTPCLQGIKDDILLRHYFKY
jgi:hypothetical protein